MSVELATHFESVISQAPELLPELAHIVPSRILVLVHKMAAARQGQTMGLRQARGGRVYEAVFPEVRHEGREVLYLVSFNPRICVADAAVPCDPLETVMHELWHIAPACDGTIRRAKHGKKFNAIVKRLAQTFRERGGRDLPTLTPDATVALRNWKTREEPSIAYVRRFPRVSLERALARARWQRAWSEADLRERITALQRLVPRTYRYVCPMGHVLECHVRFRKVRSCATCSKRFDPRFLLRPVW